MIEYLIITEEHGQVEIDHEEDPQVNFSEYNQYIYKLDSDKLIYMLNKYIYNLRFLLRRKDN